MLVWGIVVVSALVIVYRVVTRKPRAAETYLSRKLNVKPHLVGDMIASMGRERGHMFVEHMTTWNDPEGRGVYTFVIFQIMKNDHEENILWWKNKLKECGYDPTMTVEQASSGFTYLKDAGADIMKVSSFVRQYNSIN